MIPVYTGYDKREAVGWHAFTASVLRQASDAVAFIPIHGDFGDGSNAFTAARFLVPFRQRYEGSAIFADGCDMVCREDIGKLWMLRDSKYAVQVVKHNYKTMHHRKYLGTKMESPNIDYPRKNWASLMLMNCAHPAWRDVLPAVYDAPTRDLLEFKHLKDEDIGELPIEWNWLADEYGENENAKIVHWTAGIPAFKEYRETPMSDVWHHAHSWANYATE